MPKSHFPARGGPQPFAWTPTRSASPGENEIPVEKASSPRNASLHALEAENRRLRRELDRVRKNDTPGAAPASQTSHRMVWIAYALCAAALLFALSTLFAR